MNQAEVKRAQALTAVHQHGFVAHSFPLLECLYSGEHSDAYV